MKKLLVLVAVMVIASLSVAAQWADSREAVSDVQLYWQPAADVVFDPACPYLYVRPDVDYWAVFNGWIMSHSDENGNLSRPTSIGLADLAFLDLFLADADLVAMWHQIVKCGGPIDSLETLSKIKTVSLKRPEPTWTFSLAESCRLGTYFFLRMGTKDKQLPDRYQP